MALKLNLKTTFACGLVAVALVATSACGFKHKKYDNPITADSEQPDKLLYDQAIHEIERARFEQARILLQTLMNTYDSSEFMAKAKLAVADAWYREGGLRGFSQAEAEYKDFILFYPNMEEAAESQKKICEIHYKQMEKPDRDPAQALRADLECRQLLVQFPNSVFVGDAEQMLRNIQEVIADGEMRVGTFYKSRGSFNAAANRLGSVADQYPLYSRADEALWFEGQSYSRLGPRFREQEVDSYTRIVRDYPLSEYADEARARLGDLEAEVPEPDEYALQRMQFELDNRKGPGLLGKTFGFMSRGPSTWAAAKTGTPRMENPEPTVPPLVPVPGAGENGFLGDVTVAPVTGDSALDTNPDARPQQPQQAQPQQ